MKTLALLALALLLPLTAGAQPSAFWDCGTDATVVFRTTTAVGCRSDKAWDCGGFPCVVAQSGPSFNPFKAIASPPPPAAKLTPVPHVQPHHPMFSSDAYPKGWTDADEAMYEAEVLRVAHSPQSADRLKLLRELQASPGGRTFWMSQKAKLEK